MNASPAGWSSHGKTRSWTAHRSDADANEARTYFESVIAWVAGVFTFTHPKMREVEWGAFYEAFHGRPYDPAAISARAEELLADEIVTDKKGVFRDVLGGETDARLLQVRFFDDRTARAVYKTQTADAAAKGTSNCPLCALGHGANAKRIYKLEELQADHVTAWSKGGATDIKNCQTLCKTHNRAKGIR